MKILDKKRSTRLMISTSTPSRMDLIRPLTDLDISPRRLENSNVEKSGWKGGKEVRENLFLVSLGEYKGWGG